jgi:hypothetical protein
MPTIFIRKDREGNPRLTTTVTPAGQITSPHIDGTLMGSFLVALFGFKVVFEWPPTAHNLQWMSSRHCVNRGKDVEKAIAAN